MKKIIIYIVCLFSSLIIFKCSGVNLSQKIVISEKDWLMAGGSPLQQNVAKTNLAPPLNLKWDFDPEAGIGFGCVSVSDGVLFVNDLQGEMFSIDIATGKKIGILKFLGSDANSTPLIDGNNVILSYAGDNDYSLTSYNLLIAERNWRVNLGYLQTSPIMIDDYVYVGSIDGRYYKINKNDSGKTIWSFNTTSQIHSTCAISGDKLVFGADNGNVYCINANDGKEIWKYKTDGSVFATPLIKDESIYIGSYDSNYYCINLSNGSLKWKQNLHTKLFSGSTLYNEAVYFGGIDGKLYSLNMNDGSVKWSFQTKGVITGSPMLSGDNIYFTNHDYFLYAVSAETGKEKWSYALEGRGKGTPIVWDNFLFVTTDDLIYCFSK